MMLKKLGATLLITFFACSVFAQTDKALKLAAAALAIVNPNIRYDPAYVKLTYPGGDVPANTGVCTDVVIRAYRKLQIDLQQEVHEDMKANFALYPKKWGRKSPDRNIDHRRVYNLMKFFSRKGKVKAITKVASDYLPGDIVCWELPNGLTHIGIVTTQKTNDQKRYAIVHNIGGGQVLEDCLFSWKIIGHYTY